MRFLLCVVLCVVCPALAQICNSDDPDSGGLLIPAFHSGGGKPVACTNETGCVNGWLWPENDPQGMAVLYFILLMYMFLGVGVVADKFMEAIEYITSATTTRQVQRDGQSVTAELKVWNATMANLTLMALGSSAPEILLSIIEILSNEFYSGALGPSTIVGSAAFNLLVISAICVSCIPNGEVRIIEEVQVFGITAVSSVFAYLWLYIILVVVSEDIVDLWEGVLTFLFFPILLSIAFMADKGMFKKSAVSPLSREDANHLTQIKIGEIGDEGYQFDKKEVAQLIKGANAKAMTQTQAAQLASHNVQKQQKHSRMFYRMNVTHKMRGKHGVLVDKPQVDGVDIDQVPFVGFETLKYSVKESEKEVKVCVVRRGPLVPLTVAYKTVEGSAKNNDFTHVEGELSFKNGEERLYIPVEIIDDDEPEDDEIFFVELSNPRGQYKNHQAQILGNDRCSVTIINDDNAGVLEWTPTATGEVAAEYSVPESQGLLSLSLRRVNGHLGTVSVMVSTKSGTAVEDKDFIKFEERVTFESGELEKDIQIRILDDENYEKDEAFTVVLSDPKGAVLGTSPIAKVVILNDDKVKELVDAVTVVLALNLDKYRIGASNWKSQIMDVFERPEPTEPISVKIMYWVSLPFSMFFALVPPTSLFRGWACFFVALMFIGLVTAVIGDLAGLLGCSLGIKDAVTAITFVALGTSLPDTFASKTAAVMDATADASIGNITGSNSVNVFLGLGLPWLMAAIYWEINFDDKESEWAAEYPSLYIDGKKGFAVPAGDLGFSVIIFTCLAVACLLGLVVRRQLFGSELGGKYAISTSLLFICMWFVYVVTSSLKSYGKL